MTKRDIFHEFDVLKQIVVELKKYYACQELHQLTVYEPDCHYFSTHRPTYSVSNHLIARENGSVYFRMLPIHINEGSYHLVLSVVPKGSAGDHESQSLTAICLKSSGLTVFERCTTGEYRKIASINSWPERRHTIVNGEERMLPIHIGAPCTMSE